MAILSGQARRLGTGTFSANAGRPFQSGQDSYAGTGLFTANVSQIDAASASFNGLGALTANIVIWNAQTSLAGSGALSAVYIPVQAQASLAGAGSFVAAQPADLPAYTLIRPPLITRIWGQDPYRAATDAQLEGQPFVIVASSGPTTWQGLALFAGIGAFSDIANLIEAVSAQLAGTGSFTINVTLTETASSILTGNGAFVSNAQTIAPVQTILTGAGTLNPDTAAFTIKAASAIFTGSGALAGNGAFPAVIWQGQATFTGSGLSTYAAFTAGISYTLPRGPLVFRSWLPNPYNVSLNSQPNGQPTTLIPLPPTIWQSQASFVGSGTFTSSINLIEMASAAIPGNSTLSSFVTLLTPGFASFAGTGSVAGSITLLETASAILTGIGQFNASGNVPGQINTWTGQAAFAGSGSFTSSVTSQLDASSALFAGTGALSSSITLHETASAAFVGSGLIGASPAQLDVASAVLAGSGSFISISSTTLKAQAAFTGSGLSTYAAFTAGISYTLPRGPLVFRSWLVDPSRASIDAQPLGIPFQFIPPPITTWQGQAAFASSGSISPSGRLIEVASASIPGTSTLVAQPTSLLLQALTGLLGVGAFSANANTPTKLGYAAFAGSGLLVPSPYQLNAASASFDGSGVFTPTLIPQSASAAFAGSGVFTSSINLYEAASVSYTGNGTFTSSSQALLLSASAAFAGSGAFSSAPVIPLLVSTTFAGSGTFSPDIAAYQVDAASATFAGSGFLEQGANNIFQGTAILVGAGAFTPDIAASQIDAASASLLGAGAATAGGSEIYQVSTVQTGTGALTSSPNQILTASASFTGSGLIGTSPAQLEAASGMMIGAGLLNSSARCILASRSFMVGVGVFAANASVITTSSSLQGIGLLSANGTYIPLFPQQFGNTTLVGSGNIHAEADLLHNAEAALAGNGSMEVSSAIVRPLISTNTLVSPGRVRLLASPGFYGGT